MLKAAQNNLREQSSSYDLRREVEGGPRTNRNQRVACQRQPATTEEPGQGSASIPESRTSRCISSHPARSDAQISQQGFSLRDAQRAIAREYGFESWAELKNQVNLPGEGGGLR